MTNEGWVKSTFSGVGDCVEWRIGDGEVRVRDSKDPSGPALVLTPEQWEDLRAGIRAGEGA